jgi:hypothetical protein
MSAKCQKQTLCSAAVEPPPVGPSSLLAVAGNADYGVDDGIGCDGNQVR